MPLLHLSYYSTLAEDMLGINLDSFAFDGKNYNINTDTDKIYIENGGKFI